MKVVLLAGGQGTRMVEETSMRPKPMVEIGNQPILWHIMKHYAAHGYRDFAICLGYKGEHIKRYFSEFFSLASDLTIHTGNGQVDYHGAAQEIWDVDLVNTGLTTETGGRMLRVAHLLGERFMLTFGDGVSDVDLTKLVRFHESHGRLATLTAVRPPARFGHVDLDGDVVRTFSEKPQAREGWINGGFFVLERAVLDYIADDLTYFQREPLERLAQEDQLRAYRHDGFWQCMDTMRDREFLSELWDRGEAPWRTWQ